ncbi:hypothetical protein FALBO_8984 [Fusarium albosuccineum]|uniref:Uncharacterized protein n=1 Tax=Fusarium albosuccineum TaxID=1237068 RepID=A0A8H4L8N0_9HYPO|nr:hypothetical protein FALBO_8984 [Fusarium albosuccineum]
MQPSDLLTRGFGFGLREREENVGLALQRRAPIGYVPGHPRELGEDKRGLGLGAAKGLGRLGPKPAKQRAKQKGQERRSDWRLGGQPGQPRQGLGVGGKLDLPSGVRPERQPSA